MTYKQNKKCPKKIVFCPIVITTFRTSELKFAAEVLSNKREEMVQKAKKQFTAKQKQNMQFSEERFQLLETIHEMINVELNKRGIKIDQENQVEHEIKPPSIVKESPYNSLCGCFKKWWKSLMRGKT